MRTFSMLAGAMLLALLSISVTTSAVDAQAAADPTTASIKATYDMVKGYITKAAAQVPEDKYKFQATKEVRTMGAVFGHIAESNGGICATASGLKPVAVGAEKLATKAELQKALADSFAFCDKAFATITAANMNESVTLFGQLKLSRLGALAFNNSHDFEHYGNIVTYMRLNGMVPPSSSGGGGN
jgi:uncharacterized damage-inducible protein DinB